MISGTERQTYKIFIHFKKQEIKRLLLIHFKLRILKVNHILCETIEERVLDIPEKKMFS